MEAQLIERALGIVKRALEKGKGIDIDISGSNIGFRVYATGSKHQFEEISGIELHPNIDRADGRISFEGETSGIYFKAVKAVQCVKIGVEKKIVTRRKIVEPVVIQDVKEEIEVPVWRCPNGTVIKEES